MPTPNPRTVNVSPPLPAAPGAAPALEAPAEVVLADVPATSLATRGMAPDEVTVRFNRWTAHANTAYQKGQFAGFRRDEAQRLINRGSAVLAETPQQRDAAARFMLTK